MIAKVDLNKNCWADSRYNTKMNFPLQIAFYEITNDCDWIFDVSYTGQYVYGDFDFVVKAKRLFSWGYDSRDKKNEKYNEEYALIEIKFHVKGFTLENIYKAAREALIEKDKKQ